MQLNMSSLDNYQTLVVYIEPGDSGPMVDMLETRGLGYAVFGEGVDFPFVVIDQRILEEEGYTNDHLLAIEAHELGHVHEKSNDEPTAEHAGIRLLESSGHHAAAELLRERGII